MVADTDGVCELSRFPLANRGYHVVVDGISADSHLKNARVTQGPVSAPLFILEISQLMTVTSYSVRSFADDSTINTGLIVPPGAGPSAELLINNNLRLDKLNSNGKDSGLGSNNLVQFNEPTSQRHDR